MLSLKVKFKKSGRSIASWQRFIDYGLYQMVQAAVMDVGEFTKASVDSLIEGSRKRPGAITRGNLSRNFQIYKETPPGVVFVGVGKIEELNKNAPYWQVLDSGKTKSGTPYIPNHGNPVPLGEFIGGSGGPAPVPGGSGGDWAANRGTGGFTFTPKKYIEGTNYIHLTWQMANALFVQKMQEIIRDSKQENGS